MNLPELFTRLRKYDRTNGSPLSRYLVKGTLASAAMQVCAMAIAFFTPFIIARLGGAEVYGRYTYLVACISTAAGLAILGMDNLLLRQAALYKATGGAPSLKAVFIFAFCIVLGTSVLVCFLLPPFLTVTAPRAQISQFIAPALIALPIMALTILLQAGLQGMQKVIAAQLAEKFIKPIVFLLPVLVDYLVFKKHMTVFSLMWLNMFAVGAGFIWIAIHFYRHFHPVLHKVKLELQTKKWIKSGGYFFMLSLVQLVITRADVLMLGAFKGGIDVGTYNFAARLADLVSMPQFILNLITAPSIASLYFSGKSVRLKKLISASVIAACTFSLAAALALIILGNSILAFFGTGFTGGYMALVVIATAQLANVACGPAGNILAMTGFEKFDFISMVAGAATNVVLNALLIPPYGINGAAIATATGIVVWNVMMLYFVRKKIHINSSILGALIVSKV